MGARARLPGLDPDSLPPVSLPVIAGVCPDLSVRVVCVCLVAQACLTLCSPVNCGPPGSSVHGILRQEYWSGLPFLLQGIFLTQESDLSILHCRWILALEVDYSPIEL